VDHRAKASAAHVDVAGPRALRRKLAWAVGSVYGVRYAAYDSWPAVYARRAAERLVEIHGEP